MSEQGTILSLSQSAQEASNVSSFWQTKVSEFQTILNSLDQAYSSAIHALDTVNKNDPLRMELEQWIADYKSKRKLIALASNAINGGIEIMRANGVSAPKFSEVISGSPNPFSVAWSAGLATAGSIVNWGVNALKTLNDAFARHNAIPENVQLDQLPVTTAYQNAEQTSLFSLSNVVLVGGVGLIAWILWRKYYVPN